jgi:hypothetical protein
LLIKLANGIHHVMAGLVPAIHVLGDTVLILRSSLRMRTEKHKTTIIGVMPVMT